MTVRTVDLPDGRRVVVRHAGRGDATGLLALFDRLDPMDRHRRFFSGFRPDEAFVDHLLGLADEGGAILVAEVVTEGAGAIVGEAEFAVLPDGDGELGITVDRDWRGWLPPYLLDALAEVAAGRGVPNLRAVILVENRPMLVLVRARGMATVDADDRCILEAVFGTDSDVPSWPVGQDRPRVLIEVQGGRSRLTPELRAAGYDVRGCAGPSARPDHACPLLSGRRCPLVDGADVVVHALGHDDPAAVALLDAHAASGTRRLVVDVRRGDSLDDAPEGAVALATPTPAEVRAAIEALLGADDADGDQAERAQR